MFDNNDQAVGPNAFKFNNYLDTWAHRFQTINDDSQLETHDERM